MQEEVEQKTFNIVVSTTKLTARTILNAGKAAIQQQQAKMAGGKQSVRMLLRQNRGVSSVEIDKTNIRGFERYAKKYGMLSRIVPFCWGNCRHFCSINMTALILSTNLWM